MTSRLVVGLLLTIVLWVMPTQAQEKSTYQAELDELNQLLEQHPSVIPSVLNSVKEFLHQQEERRALVAKHEGWLYNNDKDHPWYGAENGSFPVVVFTDYDCPYCKRLEPNLQRLVSEFPQVKVINVMVPLRQKNVAGGLMNPANYALNVWHNQPKQFAEVHQLLYEQNGLHTKRSLEQIARKTGTRSQLTSSNATDVIITQNYRVFSDFQLRGTPAIFLGPMIIPGYVDYDDLKAAVLSVLNAAQ